MLPTSTPPPPHLVAISPALLRLTVLLLTLVGSAVAALVGYLD